MDVDQMARLGDRPERERERLLKFHTTSAVTSVFGVVAGELPTTIVISITALPFALVLALEMI